MSDEQQLLPVETPTPKPPEKGDQVGGCVVLIFVAVMGWMGVKSCLGCDDDDVEKPRMVTIGDPCYAGVRDLGAVWAATSEAANESLVKAQMAGDQIGMTSLIVGGHVVRVERNTKCLVIDSSFATLQVRLLDGKHAAIAVWLPREFVSPIPLVPGETPK